MDKDTAISQINQILELAGLTLQDLVEFAKPQPQPKKSKSKK